MNNNTIILGIDHGYGNIKSAHTCFPTGVTTYEKEPTFHNDLLIYDGHFYTIGEGHKEFTADKMMDGDYYVLTLAAIAKELSLRRLTAAKVYLAVGMHLIGYHLPLDDHPEIGRRAERQLPGVSPAQRERGFHLSGHGLSCGVCRC